MPKQRRFVLPGDTPFSVDHPAPLLTKQRKMTARKTETNAAFRARISLVLDRMTISAREERPDLRVRAVISWPPNGTSRRCAIVVESFRNPGGDESLT